MSETLEHAPTKKESPNVEESADKNIFLRDIEINAIKEALLKEIDISQIKESLIKDIKKTLLQEIDISSIKHIVTKDIMGSKKESEDVEVEDVVNDEQKTKPKKVNLPGYKYGLVESLVKDHQEILSVYETIMNSAREKDYIILPLLLSKFSKLCMNHFGEEEQLYTFMKALAGSRSDVERKVATEFSIEMKNVSVSLFTLLNQSTNIPVEETTADGFIAEFFELGEILQERIGREEKILYPMYEGSRKIVDIC